MWEKLKVMAEFVDAMVASKRARALEHASLRHFYLVFVRGLHGSVSGNLSTRLASVT